MLAATRVVAASSFISDTDSTVSLPLFLKAATDNNTGDRTWELRRSLSQKIQKSNTKLQM